jgi:hypothetical protein
MVPGLDATARFGYLPRSTRSGKETAMGRAALVVLCVCAWCGGCESTPFWQADTRSWFATPAPPATPAEAAKAPDVFNDFSTPPSPKGDTAAATSGKAGPSQRP